MSSPYRKFEDLTKIYGPVFSLRQGSEILIVIGRHQVRVVSLPSPTHSAHLAVAAGSDGHHGERRCSPRGQTP